MASRPRGQSPRFAPFYMHAHRSPIHYFYELAMPLLPELNPIAIPSNGQIAIAGAGLMGRLLAWRLLLQGHQVTLFERDRFDRPMSAAHTAAAMISPMSEVVVSERLIFDLGRESLQIWPQWLEELNQNLTTPVHYAATGSVVVAHSHDANELDQFYRDLQFHLGPDNPAQWLDGAALARLEPDLGGHFERALLLPDEAYLDNRHLLQALLERIQQLGGQCLQEQPVEFTPGPTVHGQALTGYDLVIDCRGLGAQQSQERLRGVRGEVLWVTTNEVQLFHPIRLMHPRYKLYIVPKPGQRFIIGATEIESQDRSPVSVQSMLELCSALYTLNPAFAEARILELDANLRPSYLDNLPHIEQSQSLGPDGRSLPLIQINGLYRHGYLLAPTLVQSVLNTLVTL